MPNNPEMKAAMDAVTKKMMSWPRWYFRFQLWRHRNGDIARAMRDLREFAASDEFAQAMREKE